MATPNIETSFRDRVTLTVDCSDRLYLSGYVPRLQTSAQLCWSCRSTWGIRSSRQRCCPRCKIGSSAT